MPIEILMPALSPTMTEGTLAKWLKGEGDAVASGDAIAEIETDKATMEVEAVDEGVLGRILVPAGTEAVAVNRPIALLLEEGEDAASLDSFKSKAGAAPSGGDQPEAAQPVEAPPKPTPQPTAQAGTAHDGRVFASPLARRMAGDAGIDLAAISGSGPRGRIIKRDVEEAVAKGVGRGAPAKDAAVPTEAPAPAAKPAPAAPPTSSVDARRIAEAYGIPFTEIKHNNVRKTVARRLLEAKQTIPHFYLSADFQVDKLMAMRKELNGKSDLRLSVNDFVVKAAAIALRRVPEANASWTDDAILMYERVDVAVAVATDNGLITPIVKDADRKGLAEISREVKDLAARAREGKLRPEEFSGGTFTVSNLGMYGVKEFAAIINPPQSCILAVGESEKRPVVKDGAVAIATMMTGTLSVDHRAVDGAVGGLYLKALKRLIEDPIAMLL